MYYILMLHYLSLSLTYWFLLTSYLKSFLFICFAVCLKALISICCTKVAQVSQNVCVEFIRNKTTFRICSLLLTYIFLLSNYITLLTFKHKLLIPEFIIIYNKYRKIYWLLTKSRNALLLARSNLLY